MSETRVPELHGIKPDGSLSTKYLLDATEHEAHNQGEWAYTFGMNVSVNPYVSGSQAFDWWMAGWYAGQENDGG